MSPAKPIRLLVLPVVLVAVGCAHSSQRQMTEEEHIAESARHREAAGDEEKRYDPGARTMAEVRSPFSAPTLDAVVENPTVHHLRAADAHLRAAAQHDAEAKTLSVAEEKACHGLAPGERQACPLWTAVVRASEETALGVRLSLKSGVDGEALAAGMRCHLAHGRAHGWEGGCPLVVPGASVVLVNAGTLEIRGDSGRSAAVIQAEARELFGLRRPIPVSAR